MLKQERHRILFRTLLQVCSVQLPGYGGWDALDRGAIVDISSQTFSSFIFLPATISQGHSLPFIFLLVLWVRTSYFRLKCSLPYLVTSSLHFWCSTAMEQSGEGFLTRKHKTSLHGICCLPCNYTWSSWHAGVQ